MSLIAAYLLMPALGATGASLSTPFSFFGINNRVSYMFMEAHAAYIIIQVCWLQAL